MFGGGDGGGTGNKTPNFWNVGLTPVFWSVSPEPNTKSSDDLASFSKFLKFVQYYNIRLL